MPTASWLALAAILLAPPLQAPLRTTLPWNLPDGRWEISAGVSRESGARPAFFTCERDFRRDVWRAQVDAGYGAGPRSEVRLQAGWQRFHEEGAAAVSSVEDVRLTFTHQLPVKPIAVALHAGVKLPNASNERRAGTDEADITLSASAGWRGSRWGAAGEAGLGILGNPRETAAQDDVAVLSLAAWRYVGPGPGFALLTLEASGQAASRLGNDVRRATGSLTLLRPRAPITIVAGRGLTKVSEDWSLAVRLTVVPPFRGD